MKTLWRFTEGITVRKSLMRLQCEYINMTWQIQILRFMCADCVFVLHRCQKMIFFFLPSFFLIIIIYFTLKIIQELKMMHLNFFFFLLSTCCDDANVHTVWEGVQILRTRLWQNGTVLSYSPKILISIVLNAVIERFKEKRLCPHDWKS